MIKEDEKELLRVLQERTIKDGYTPGLSLGVVNELGMNTNRAVYLFSKWCDRGLYESGCTMMGGWLSEKGIQSDLEHKH